MGSIDQDDVIQILKIVGQSTIDEFHLEIGDAKLILKKSSATDSYDEMINNNIGIIRIILLIFIIL